MVDNRFRQLSHVITFAPTGLAMIWPGVAIVASLVLGKLRGFMTVEFVMPPCFCCTLGSCAVWCDCLNGGVCYLDSER